MFIEQPGFAFVQIRNQQESPQLGWMNENFLGYAMRIHSFGDTSPVEWIELL
jgi:hypothetical protein